MSSLSICIYLRNAQNLGYNAWLIQDNVNVFAYGDMTAFTTNHANSMCVCVCVFGYDPDLGAGKSYSSETRQSMSARCVRQ